MIVRYALLAGRIRQDVAEVERVVERVERAIQSRRQGSADGDLLLDSAALNLHDGWNASSRRSLPPSTKPCRQAPTRIASCSGK
jgi:hypothetical protein